MLSNLSATECHGRVKTIQTVYLFIHIAVDFLAALLFIIGSIFFFYTSLLYAGTWLFLVGSVLFGVKPTLKLVYFFHIHHLFKGQTGDVAQIIQNHQDHRFF